ncbi:MAG TPA: FtsX-like permease family protein [Bacteroidetes bacterium]|nr:FtsX-like permease family protein [Bacteroidota bacterium]
MTAIKLAYRNLIGAGLRTWLNVIVLSFSFVMIIWMKGMLDGWDRQARIDSIEWETGGGQYWHENYDPYDPFTFEDSHAPLTPEQENLWQKGKLVPVLITRGTIYPGGRMQNIVIKGIDVNQKLLSIPTARLDTSVYGIPAVVGSNMAQNSRLKKGDRVVVRWRDANGTFDADEVVITGIFNTTVPSIDAGQIWIPLKDLQRMTLLENEATLLVRDNTEAPMPAFAGWKFMEQDELLKDIETIIKSKTAGTSVFYMILLLLALLVIFDTQVLSVFRRQKEIGTYVAMGMTKKEVVTLFTVEGGMHAVLAVVVGAVYGIPLFIQQSTQGISFGLSGQDIGITMAETLYPLYSMELVISTIFIIVVATTFVSFIPARKISGMNPTEAIKGKIQ